MVRKSERTRMPVSKERAEAALLKFHQLCLASFCGNVAGESMEKVNTRDAAIVRDFLHDCRELLPTEDELGRIWEQVVREPT
jgi:hypothetical protein